MVLGAGWSTEEESSVWIHGCQCLGVSTYKATNTKLSGLCQVHTHFPKMCMLSQQMKFPSMVVWLSSMDRVWCFRKRLGQPASSHSRHQSAVLPEGFGAIFTLTFIGNLWKWRELGGREKKMLAKDWSCSFPAQGRPSVLLVVLICCCHGENKSISHGSQPVPRSGSATEIQEQTLRISTRNRQERV